MSGPVKLCLRVDGTEFPALLTLRDDGSPRALALVDPSAAPLELLDRVQVVSRFMATGLWDAVRTTAASSPRFLPIVERVSEAIAPHESRTEEPAA